MGEKTEQPTPHRLTRARDDGDVAKSTALTVTVSGALWWLFLLIEAPHLYDELVTMTSRVLQLDMNQSFTTRLDVLLDAVAGPAESALVALGFAMLAVCAPEFAQTRGLIAGKHAAPDFKRINPVEGFKKLFGMKVLFDTGLMLVQFALVTLMCWLEIARWLAQIVPAFALTLPSQLALAGRVHTHLLALVCLSQLAPSAVDYAIQHFLRKRRLRMDKEELKREFRDQQGDPQTKRRRRAEHRQLSN